MNYQNCEFDFWEQGGGIDGMYKQMERAARICYRTENLITDTSAYKIIDDIIIPSGHTSVLEFGSVYLYCIYNANNENENNWWRKYENDKFSRVVINFDKDNNNVEVYISTNYCRIMRGDYELIGDAVENKYDKNWKDDLKYWREPTKYHKQRKCVHMVMDRVGSQSVERHRGLFGISYAQESTRYINYNRDKFGNEITIAVPAKFYDLIIEWSQCVDSLTGESFEYIKTAPFEEQLNFLRCHDRGWCAYENALETAEREYMYLIGEEGWRPEDARGVLPLDIKTEFAMCAYDEDWKTFFYRRNDKHAHHQINSFSKKLFNKFIEKGYING